MLLIRLSCRSHDCFNLRLSCFSDIRLPCIMICCLILCSMCKILAGGLGRLRSVVKGKTGSGREAAVEGSELLRWGRILTGGYVSGG